jgi:hypothetical protein
LRWLILAHIHRDIKPSNVLVTMYDDKPVPLQRRQQLPQGRRVKPWCYPHDPAIGRHQFQSAGHWQGRVGHDLHRYDGGRVGGALQEVAPPSVEGGFSQAVSGTEVPHAQPARPPLRDPSSPLPFPLLLRGALPTRPGQPLLHRFNDTDCVNASAQAVLHALLPSDIADVQDGRGRTPRAFLL